MALAFVTGNRGKMAEARVLLGALTDLEQDDAGYPEIQADTLEEVARAGLEAVGQRRDPPFFLEDAGLFVDPLHGFPGVYSAYVLYTIGLDGLLRLLNDPTPTARRAHFAAVVGYRDPDGTDHLFRGEVTGTLSTQARGTQGFGYDPLFCPDSGDGRTFAELTPDEKATHSHRGAAMRDFATHLKTHLPS